MEIKNLNAENTVVFEAILKNVEDCRKLHEGIFPNVIESLTKDLMKFRAQNTANRYLESEKFFYTSWYTGLYVNKQLGL